MTDLLENSIGANVACLYVVDGKMNGRRGKLVAVNDQYITLDDQKISFVEDNVAIYAIYDEKNTILYRNDIALVMSNMVVSTYSAPAETVPEVPRQPVTPVEKGLSSEELDNMFKSLVGYIGNPVHIVYMHKGIETKLIGKLNNCLPYDSATIDSNVIQFIGPYTGIVDIITLGGKSLYHNGKVIDYNGCKSEDIFAIINAQENYLGKSVAREELMNKDKPRG